MTYVAYMIESMSSVTNYDYVAIVAGMMRLGDGDLDCGRCKVKYPNPEASMKHRERKGCFDKRGVISYIPKYEMAGHPKIRFKRCPVYFADPNIMGLKSDLALYRKGVMPYPGGHYSQPAKFSEIMALLSTLEAEEQSELEALKKTIRRNGARS